MFLAESVLYGLGTVVNGKPIHYSNQPAEPKKQLNLSLRQQKMFQRTYFDERSLKKYLIVLNRADSALIYSNLLQSH